MASAPDPQIPCQPLPVPARISVIIPTRNEQAHLGPTLEAVFADPPHQVIVVDARSTDNTPAIARRFPVTFLQSAPGRSRQMRRGAAHATGDILLFLHADTRLPPAYQAPIRRALVPRSLCVAGAFTLRIDDPSLAFRLIEYAVHLRCRLRRMPYGDQAIFVRASALTRIGGMPDTPLLEDVQLIRRLRKRGRIAILPNPVHTSARRWRDHGICRTTALNQLCLLAHRLGIPAARIAAWRNRTDPVTPPRHPSSPP